MSSTRAKTRTNPKTRTLPADRVTNLPGLGHVDDVQFAGYASVRGETGFNGAEVADESLFYWFVGTKNYDKQPTILWTNGGPGSSSFWGFFLENGPYIIDPKGTKLTKRPTAWNNYANYIIFEHPLSVTLSFAKDANDIPTTVEMGTAQLYQALLTFIALHPEIANNPFILAGESYAGTYLPLLSKAILEGNRAGRTQLDLRAMALLDAWVNPMAQMAMDTTWAFAHGLLSASQNRWLDETYRHRLPQVNAAIQKICGCYMTNIAQTQDPPFEPVYDYLNNTLVREALHVPVHSPHLTHNWSQQIANNYAPHVNDSYAGVVEELLDGGPNGGQDPHNQLLLLDGKSKLKVQVISGLNDAKDCNFLGTGAWLDLLQGDTALAFQSAMPTQWKDDHGNMMGFVQDGGLLSWLKVLNAGHMAAKDQPQLIHYILKALN